MRYRCLACEAELTIASSAAWPERCPYCHAAPLATSSGLLLAPLTLPASIGARAGNVGGEAAVAGELLERARELGSAAA